MTLPDARAREQVIQATGETLFVEAAAGAGKTTALVGRIVALVAGGMPIERIAAITFTEKAAAELTDRVRERLERAAAGDGEYDRLGPEERERCRVAIEELDGASFQTIHAFARKLLAGHPVQAGLPPEFEVLDGTEEELELREAVRRFLDEVERRSETRTAVMTAYMLGLQPRHLRELAREFARNWDRLRDGKFELPAAEPNWKPPLGDLLEELELSGQSADAFRREVSNLQEISGRLDEAYERYRAASDPGEREAGLAELLTLAGRVKIPLKGNQKATLQPVKDGWEAWLAALRRWALERVLPAVQAFALEYARERRRRGRLTFHDLLVLTTDLLRSDEAARRAVHGRFGQVLIDEFQDTDPLQVELAALIAADPGQPADWQTADVAPGRLFFVGDPKQSIYRFRRADIRIYQQAKGAFRSKEVRLATNFRSAQTVIAWVNGVCRQLFEANGSGVQADWVDLEARLGAPDGQPVRVFGKVVDASAAEVREREAADIARGVLQARAENWGGREGGTRFEDIAILLPRRTVLPELERALADRGIPYRIESQSLLYSAEEVRDLLNVLTAIDDPTDEVALVAALRSPLFACTDRELAEHAAAGGRWSYEKPAPDGSPDRVRQAMAQLAAWHRERWTVSPAGLIERLIAESHLLLKALGDTRPRETWRRYRIIAEQARALTVRGAVATLRQFTAWLEQQQDEGVRVNEAIAPEPDDDAVRVMTVHAAKGLEFPVVFVAGLGSGANQAAPVRTWWPPHGERRLPEVRCGSNEQRFETARFAEVEAEEKAHEEAEAARLFYVAATRAQHALAVSLYRTKRADGGSLAARVEAALEAAGPETFERWTPLEPTGGREAGLAPGALPPVPAADAWRERRESAAKRAAAPVAAATVIAHALAADAPEEPEEPPASPAEPWRKGRAGTAIGRAVHAVLQGIDLATGEGLEAAARAQAEAEGIADRAGDVERLARHALESEAVRAAAASGRYWREVYVGAELEGVLIEGFIDLLYESPHGLVIVDYKTDGLRSEEDADRVMPQYRLQAGAYAAALERATGRPAAAAVFVFTEPRLERRIDDLEAAKAEALERARALTGLAASAGG